MNDYQDKEVEGCQVQFVVQAKFMGTQQITCYHTHPVSARSKLRLERACTSELRIDFVGVVRVGLITVRFSASGVIEVELEVQKLLSNPKQQQQ